MSSRQNNASRKRNKDTETDTVNDELMQTPATQPDVDRSIVDTAAKRIRRVKVWLFIGEEPMFRLLKTAETYGMASGLLYRITEDTPVKSLETCQRIAEGCVEFGVDFRNFTVLCSSSPRKTKSQSIIDAIIRATDMIIVVREKHTPTIVAADELPEMFPPS